MYFGRRHGGCGDHARPISHDLDGAETVLHVFPEDRDFASSFAVSNPNDTTDVYFDPGRRGLFGLSGNILKLSGV